MSVETFIIPTSNSCCDYCGVGLLRLPRCLIVFADVKSGVTKTAPKRACLACAIEWFADQAVVQEIMDQMMAGIDQDIEGFSAKDHYFTTRD